LQSNSNGYEYWEVIYVYRKYYYVGVHNCAKISKQANTMDIIY